MEFRIRTRSCRIDDGWRLATVEEAQKNVESIKQLLQEWKWERARLLDGWIGGSAYHFQPTVGFRSCLGYMLVVESSGTTPNFEICDSDERGKDVYSKVNLSEEGKSAALFLCCEDWNYDVVCWLLNVWSQKKISVSSNKEIVEASKSVGNLARDLQSTSTLMRRIQNKHCLHASLTAMVSDIVEAVEKNVRGMPLVSQLGDIYDELHLTEDLGCFEFGLHTPVDSTREKIADTLWYFAADAIAVTTVRNFTLMQEKNIHGAILTREGEMMGDLPLIASIFAWANQVLVKSCNDYTPLWDKVRDEGCKSFHETLHPQEYGTLSYKAGRYGVLNRIILRAAKEGDLALVKRLIKCGVQPIQTDDKRKKTALHHAAKLDNESNGVAIAEILLTAGLTESRELANAVDYKGRTPLHRAAACGHASMCELLIKHNARVTSRDKKGQIPLHYAIGREHLHENVIQHLTKEDFGKTVDTEDLSGLTPLGLAVECQSSKVRNIVTGLLSLSSQPEACFGKLDHLASYLRLSSRMGNSDLVKKLLKRGADPLDRDAVEKTAFHYAVEGKDEEVAKEIIKHLGEENLVRALDKYGRSVLHVCSSVWTQGTLSMAYKPGEDSFLNRKKKNSLFGCADVLGQTALHKAASGGHRKVVKKLLEEGAHPLNERDCDGRTALHYAVQAEDSNDAMAIAKRLLKKCDSSKGEKALLLFASAVGTGSPQKKV
ncbi:hypothetical protein KI387_022786 [Taxus chinensis]|uniref:Uncharacterized protein n=1 Tax=Taxus chinensis TaxID=29808 RepID=A0AA38G3H0_TAXCH|nr:hypothetical protein KI387_022786 [Taxus chinensis]